MKLTLNFFRSFDDSQSAIIMNLLRKKYDLLGPMRYIEKNLVLVFTGIVLLWLFRDPKVINGWGNLFSLGYVSDGTVAIFVAMLLFILPAENPFTYKSKNGIIPTIMTWQVKSFHIQKSVNFSTCLSFPGRLFYYWEEGTDRVPRCQQNC
jgi:hypothetical protein